MLVRSTCWGKSQIESIPDLVSRSLNGDDYDRGALEASRATADATSRALGRLVEVLVGKKLLTVDELSQVAGIFEDTLELLEDR